MKQDLIINRAVQCCKVRNALKQCRGVTSIFSHSIREKCQIKTAINRFRNVIVAPSVARLATAGDIRQTSNEQSEGYASDVDSNTFGSEYSYDGSAFAISISSIENELDEVEPSYNYYYDSHYRECGMDCIECNDDE
uniref:Uncharacterized protein n=1 Tax=Glossina austeni TaxID=7395 RepID=A0A1A9VPN0_GLOAU